MNTIDHEAIQPFRGGAVGRGSFQKVTSNCRAKVVKHVEKKVEDHYWLYDGLYEDCVEQIVIEHDRDTDSGSDDTECSGSDDGSSAEGNGDESSMDE